MIGRLVEDEGSRRHLDGTGTAADEERRQPGRGPLSAMILRLAVMVIAGSAVYASSLVQPAEAYKLSGSAVLGRAQVSEGQEAQTVCLNPHFLIWNPDSENEVNIARLTILQGDGTVIYDGPFRQLLPEPEVISTGHTALESLNVTRLTPHQYAAVTPVQWVRSYDGGQPDWAAALNVPSTAYSVEVHWTTAGGGLPLRGTVVTEEIHTVRDSDGKIVKMNSSSSRVEMENAREGYRDWWLW
jgi:hypothetical protein